MAARSAPPTEFSRFVPSSRISEKVIEKTIEARPGERAALAKRLGLVSLDLLTATIQLARPTGSEVIRLAGNFEALVTQSCVLTLEPVTNRIAARFAVDYSLGALAEPAEVAIDCEDEDPPEPLVGGGIDVGEAVTQQLAVAIDPYPRAPGAQLQDMQWGESGPDQESDNPFAVLKTLKRRRQD